MAHFVSLEHNPPDPEDDLEALYATPDGPDGSASVGLWGMMDGKVWTISLGFHEFSLVDEVGQSVVVYPREEAEGLILVRSLETT